MIRSTFGIYLKWKAKVIINNKTPASNSNNYQVLILHLKRVHRLEQLRFGFTETRKPYHRTYTKYFFHQY
jgi:hypothetical protein